MTTAYDKKSDLDESEGNDVEDKDLADVADTHTSADNTVAEGEFEGLSDVDYSGWWRRVAAWIVDAVIPALVIVAIAVGIDVFDRPPWLSVIGLILAPIVLGLTLGNLVYLQGITGFTLGKSAMQIRTKSARNGHPIGWLTSLIRQILHLLDTVVLFVGWFNPLWDRQSRTFADKVTKTVVVRVIDLDRAATRNRRTRWGVAAVTVIVLGLLAGVVAAQQFSQNKRDRVLAANSAQAVTTASEAATALLSYSPETADHDLVAVRSKLTGNFLDYYSQYTDSVVIPTAKEEGVSTTAKVVGASTISVSESNATVLLFLDQSTTTSAQPEPAATASSVSVELVKVGDTFLVNEFRPM